MAPAASPRNTICGHLIGVCAAVLSLALFGLSDAGHELSTGMSGARVGAVALSLGLTSGAMVWLKVPHPPAGANQMIISLGILTGADNRALLMEIGRATCRERVCNDVSISVCGLTFTKQQ